MISKTIYLVSTSLNNQTVPTAYCLGLGTLGQSNYQIIYNFLFRQLTLHHNHV